MILRKCANLRPGPFIAVQGRIISLEDFIVISTITIDRDQLLAQLDDV